MIWLLFRNACTPERTSNAGLSSKPNTSLARSTVESTIHVMQEIITRGIRNHISS